MAAPILYDGTELLVIEPMGGEAAQRAVALEAAGETVAGVHGAGHTLFGEALPKETLALEWLCDSREELADLRAFLARRAGRLNPFWLSTFQHDVTPLSMGGSSLTYQANGYAALFPLIADTPQPTERWVLRRPDGFCLAVEVEDVTDNGDGTETLFFAVSYDSPLTADYPLSTFRVSRLRYARLEADEITTEYLAPALARVRVSAVTCPADAP